MGSSIKDVAARARVSIATVSRHVNRTGLVRPETAARIQQAIDELGFRPNFVGRSLKTAETRTIGVMIPALSNPVFAESVAGITEVAREAGHSIMFTSSDDDPDAEVRAVGSLLEYRAAGLVLTVADPADSPALAALDASGVPYVLIYNQPGRHGRPTVTVDNLAAGRDAAEALIGLGHRRLGMISGAFRASDRAIARRDGFIARVAEEGLPAPLVREIDFVHPDAGAALAELILDRTAAPSALFCTNDLLAISVIGALERRGLEVPGDVSVIGFDGIAVGALLHPRLATVVQPAREMGAAATRQLLARIAGDGAAESVILAHHVNLAESAGPAAKSSPADLPMPAQPGKGET